ncbi:MAG: tetratricopeptide repeat protein [Deltaproteobacteria bacterium]
MRARAAFAAALLVLPAAAPAAGQSPPPPDSADAVTAGRAAFDARDPETALRDFERALAADSTSYEANWRAALALITLGAQTPDSVKSPERDSLYARAERYARRAVLADSMGADGHFILARAIGQTALTKGTKQRIRLASEVRREALRAIELDPQHDGAYHVLGRWNAEIMRLSGVSRFFARQFLGAGIFSKASWDGAITNLERAVEIDPRRIVHRLDLARVYVDRKRYGDARRELETLDTLPIRDFNDPRYQADGAALLQRIESKRDGK